MQTDRLLALCVLIHASCNHVANELCCEQVLVLNRTKLPAEALFLIRHQRFFALNRPGAPYAELLCEGDRMMVPWLARFRELSAYKRAPDQAQRGRLTGQAFREYYNGLIRKYIPSGTLRW